jgi:hypothetical protein
MMTIRIGIVLLIAASCLAGCRGDHAGTAQQPDELPKAGREPAAQPADQAPPKTIDDVHDPLDVVRSGPSPELALAVERGEARPAGPVTEARYEYWLELANRRVDLEMHRGKAAHLVRLLELADHCEQQFLERFVRYGAHPGRSADRQLQIFAAVRSRLQSELQTTQDALAQLRQPLEPETPPGGPAADPEVLLIHNR